MSPEQRADRLLSILAAGADSDYIGESVSQLEHALQAAARARAARASDELVLAALFHDIGHLVAPDGADTLGGFGIADHEALGADLLAEHGCSPAVTEPIREHVRAKRYLCGEHAGYLAKLSDASRETLRRQGGPLTGAALTTYGARADLKGILAVRAWDDQAKEPAAVVPGLDSYRDLLVTHLARSTTMIADMLTPAQLAQWERDHFLVLRRPFDEAALARLRSWTDEIAAWPESPGLWMKYFESTARDARQLCRVENFTPYHQGMRDLLYGPGLFSILAKLMGEPALLFKEKINFKLPGGGGFAAHQDAPAFVTFNQRYHITLLVAIDAATPENGCLEMSDPVAVYTTLPQREGGALAEAVEAERRWTPLPLEAGDVVLFDSYIPHRSAGNLSDRSRRALYVTYNRRSEGDVRDAYVAHKRASFPPECERVVGRDYSAGQAIYNLGNPIR